MDDDYFTSQFQGSGRNPSFRPGQRNITLSEAIDEFTDEARARGLADATLDNIRLALDPLRSPTFGLDPETPLSAITKMEMITYLERRFDPEIANRSYAIGTRRGTIQILKTFFKWAHGNGLTGDSILQTLKLPRPVLRRIVPLTDREIMLMFEVIYARSIRKLRNASMVSLMLDSGLRRSEVARLKKTDIDLDERYVHVYGKNRERLVGFGKKTGALLGLYAGHSTTKKRHGGDHLFLDRQGYPITRFAVSNVFAWLKLTTGIKRLNAHLLRHTFSTRFLQRGGDPFTLRILLGHSTFQMTAIYVATAESTSPDILRDRSIVDETKSLGSILQNYTKSSVVRRTLTGRQRKDDHKNNTLFIPKRKGEK